ncbi:MAG: hypothetical protein ACWGON_06260, partial [Gemmatimonadota bacterium]
MDRKGVTRSALLAVRRDYGYVAELLRDTDQEIQARGVDTVVVGAEYARPPAPRLGAGGHVSRS